jgi:hypothetical protein
MNSRQTCSISATFFYKVKNQPDMGYVAYLRAKAQEAATQALDCIALTFSAKFFFSESAISCSSLRYLRRKASFHTNVLIFEQMHREAHAASLTASSFFSERGDTLGASSE